MSSRVQPQAPVRELPGEAVPYYLADGDGRAHLLLGQVGRALAGSEETAGAMSVMTALGPAGRPIPMHRHEREHDYFFCVRGAIQVWADGASRTRKVAVSNGCSGTKAVPSETVSVRTAAVP